MSEAPVLCMPVFAEGRDRKLVLQLVAAMRLPGVVLLDYALDAYANRSTITIAGPPEAVCEAAIRAAGVAAERIDLTRSKTDEHGQSSAHATTGAADVIPFIPFGNSTLGQCVMLAREAAEALWSRYSLPAYLYGAAAARLDRVQLEEVQRGRFEELRKAVLRDAGRRPDVGGPGLHPTAGASIVGARSVLMEYRISLMGRDIGVARTLARKLRESGISGVRAIGLPADGGAYVAVLITEVRAGVPAAVHAATLRAASKYKAALGRWELIGLIPEHAYEAGSPWIAALDGFDTEKHILERRLRKLAEWPL